MDSDRIIRQEESYRVPINPQHKINPKVSSNEFYEIRQMILDELTAYTQKLGLYPHPKEL